MKVENEKIKTTTKKYINEEAYWLEKFAGELTYSFFPYDYRHADNMNYQLNQVRFELEESIRDRLITITNNADVKIFILYAAAIIRLLADYTDNDDIIVGIPIYRQQVDGEFINTVLSLRNHIDNRGTFREFLLQVRQSIIEANEYANYPFEKLIYKLGLINQAQRPALFDVVLLMENIHSKKYIQHLNANIIFSIVKMNHHLEVVCEYNRNLYQKTTIERYLQRFAVLLEFVLFNPDSALTEINLFLEKEQECILHNFNNQSIAYPKNKTINTLFEEQVKKAPHKTAIVFEDQHVTYGDLDKNAGKLAYILRAKGVRENSIVGLMLSPSIELIVAILGIMKAGAVYLPIDANYPLSRIRYMFQDSRSQLLLSQRKILLRHSELKNVMEPGNILYLEDIKFESIEAGAIENHQQPGDLIYIIYTSGTTGRPKGTLIQQEGLVNLVYAHRHFFAENSQSRMSQVASASFDAMAFELWPCLLCGANLIIARDEIRTDPERMQSWLIKEQVTHSFQPTIMGKQLLMQEWPDCGTSLQALRLAGDMFNFTIQKNYPFKIYNLYGPTEDTVWTTGTEINGHLNKRQSVIGKPIANHQVFIMGKDSSIKPVGIKGELCISGIGLARGYLNQPELTHAKFIDNGALPSIRIYRTGDIARWLDDGNIEIFGRMDDQVNIRGVRVELQEIKSQLINHEAVNDAIIITGGDDDLHQFICAYYVADREIEATVLRDFLSNKLPQYMMPSYFIKIDNIPVNAHGKIDYKALPTPRAKIADEYTPPRNEIEKILVQIWQDVLDVKQLGITDNFFDLGGDSIKAIQIFARLNQYDLKIEMKDLFQYPEIENVSQFVKPIKEKIEQGPVHGELPLTPIQHWFFQTQSVDRHHYNLSIMLFRKEGFDENIIPQVFQKIIAHHDALRIVFQFNHDNIVQYNRGLEGKMYDFEVFQLETDPDFANTMITLADQIQRGMNLEKGPVVRLGLFKTPNGDHLLIAIHHLVVDGISWRIILEDFAAGYQNLLDKKDIHFPGKTHSFKEWANRLTAYSGTRVILKEIQYWKVLEETDDIAVLPKEHVITGDQVKDNAQQSIKISQSDTNRLLHEVNQAYNTEINDILLCALGRTIQAWTGKRNILIDLESHGREELFENVDVTRTVGYFTSVYPVILEIAPAADLSYQLRRTKEILRHIPDKGIGYGILKYLVQSPALKFNLKPEISFNYLGQFDRDLNTELFQLSEISAGMEVSENCNRTNSLEFNAVVLHEQLLVSVNYNKNEFEKSTIEKLLKDYLRNLKEIINHCLGKDDAEKTPSDFGDDDLSIEDLEEITKVFAN